jgi:hypothetical protein
MKPDTPFEKGRKAWWMGLHETANPFEVYSFEYSEWHRGWMQEVIQEEEDFEMRNNAYKTPDPDF